MCISFVYIIICNYIIMHGAQKIKYLRRLVTIPAIVKNQFLQFYTFL